MDERQNALLREFYAAIDEKYRPMFEELASFAASLGYLPTRNKTRDLSIDFKNTKSRTAIMKMEVKEQRHDGFACGARNVPGLRLKFYASESYSEIFQRAVRRVIEDFGGRYTGCYGCGRCPGAPEGYTYVYPDGKTVFRCGRELLCVFDFDGHTQQIKALLKRQAEYFARP